MPHRSRFNEDGVSDVCKTIHQPQISSVQNICTKGQIKVKDTFMSATSTDTVDFTEETFLLNQIYLSCIKHSK